MKTINVNEIHYKNISAIIIQIDQSLSHRKF